ncbi:MAG: hypothetical protein LC793_09995 [Thermomicrobia bacterium]|nr:hypothetical protein [Thermomicrobia bacterium]
MSDLQERITKRTRAEVRYLHGHRNMNLERFRSYRSEFQAAYERSDFRKMYEVVQDSVMISNDTIHLIRKRIAISARRSFFLIANNPHNECDDTQSSPSPSCDD